MSLPPDITRPACRRGARLLATGLRRAATAWGAAALLAAGATGTAGAGVVANVRGSIAVGYTKLIAGNAPGGSLSTSGGLSYPLTSTLSVGPTITYSLLGGRTVERGSLIANVDYSAFETALLAHWKPEGWGPIGLISAGPELFNAHAELSTSGGGAAFSDLAKQKTVGGAALDVTVIQKRESPVRVGLELGGRWAFLPGEDWKLASVRLCFHY